MFRRRRLTLLATGLIVAILAGGLSAGVALGQGGGSSVSVAVRGTNVDDTTVSFSITVNNKGAAEVTGLQIVGILPENTTLVSTYAGEQGQNPAEVQESRVVWFSGSLAAGAGNGPYVFVVKKNDPVQVLETHGEVFWTGPDKGTTISAVAEVQPTEKNPPRRACGPGSCHSPESRYNLVNEAMSAAKDMGRTHPPLTAPQDTSVFVCLACHAPGKGAREGLGKAAPWSLRDLVHPIHLFSFTFTQHYMGNCWSCHTVHSTGRFTLLWGLPQMTSGGVPLNPPLTGIGPSEDWPENVQ